MNITFGPLDQVFSWSFSLSLSSGYSTDSHLYSMKTQYCQHKQPDESARHTHTAAAVPTFHQHNPDRTGVVDIQVRKIHRRTAAGNAVNRQATLNACVCVYFSFPSSLLSRSPERHKYASTNTTPQPRIAHLGSLFPLARSCTHRS